MVIRRKLRYMSLRIPVSVGVLAGVSSIALVAGFVNFSTPTVQADVRLSRPPATLPPNAPLEIPAPVVVPRQTAAEQLKVKAEEERRADILHGIATWYGGPFNGRRTASGELYDMNAMTACHPTLPFGSIVRVVNIKNKHSVVVRITDRGDLLDGRIIDLSYAAAEKLKMARAGLATVDLQVISLGHGGYKNE
jgi:rare lipoprotein A (peptidoglycan hydrolase)